MKTISLAEIVRPSLRGRLILALSLLFLIGSIATWVYQTDLSNRDWFDVGERTMQAQALALSRAYAQRPSAPLAALPADWRAVYQRPGGNYGFTIYDRSLRPIASSPSLGGRGLPIGELPPPGAPFGRLDFIGPAAVPTLTARLPAGGFAVVSRGGGWNEALAESIDHDQLQTVLVFALWGAATVMLIAIIVPWTLRPLARASREAAAIGPHRLEGRIEAHGLPAEVEPLVRAFNAALDRLGEAYALHRRITANAAHQLRTPLAVLSLRLQHARMGDAIDWPAITEDLARMQRLIGQLLDLARKQARTLLDDDRGEVNLARIVREAAALVLPLAELQGRPLEVTIPGPVALPDARADDLRDMVRNLIENALLHGAGKVSIGVDRDAEGMVRLSVADEGLPPAEGDALFEEFRKGAESEKGAGLGLAIVQQVAAAHRGAARFVPGAVTTVEVAIPAPASDLPATQTASAG